MDPRGLCVVTAVLAFVSSTLAYADLGAPTPEGIGARANGMGGAYVAVAEGGAAMFHNPAGLGVGRGVSFFGQTNVTGRDEVRVDPKGATYGWRGWGLGWGNRIAQDQSGLADYTYLSVGHRVCARLATGMSVKLWRTHPTTDFQVLGNSATYDAGILIAPSGLARIGARVGQHERGGRPGLAVVGVSQRFGTALVSAETEWRRPETWRARIGVELEVVPGVDLRGGWNHGGLAAGLGVAIGPVALDGSWSVVAGHRVLTVGAEIRL